MDLPREKTETEATEVRKAEAEGEDSTDEEEFLECPKRMLAAGPQDNQVVIFMTDGSSPRHSSAINFAILMSFFAGLASATRHYFDQP